MSQPASTSEPYRISNLGRHSVVYGVGIVLTKAVSVLMLPIYTRWLTPSDYGVLQLITMTFEIVTILAGSRLALGVYHFYHRESHEEGRREVLSTAFLLLAVTYSATAVATTIAAPSIARVVFGEVAPYATFIRLAAVTMVFEGLILVPTALLQLQDRSKLFVVATLSRLGLHVVCNLIFLIPLGLGVLGVLLSGLISSAMLAGFLSVWLLRSVGARMGSQTVRSFLRFGLPLVVMNVAAFIATFGDRFFLNRAADTTAVGLYGLAYQFGFLVSAIGFGPFRRMWDPQRFAVAKRDDRDAIFSRVFIYLNIYLLTVALGASLFAGDALRIMATPDFQGAAVFVPVLAAAYVIQSWAAYLNLGIYITERTERFAVANWAAAIVALLGYIFLIPLLLAWGAVLATLASMMTLCAFTYVYSQRLWRVEYEWAPVVWLTAVALVVGGVSALLPTMRLWLSIVAHGALLVAFGVLVWTLPILTPYERGAVFERIRRRLRPQAEAS
jgi:O-antigen/teichoic acid export membrane protein